MDKGIEQWKTGVTGQNLNHQNSKCEIVHSEAVLGWFARSKPQENEE